MIALLKRHGLKYLIFITCMVGCNACSQEYCIGQIDCPVNRDDFEDMRCLISGHGFSYGLAHGKLLVSRYLFIRYSSLKNIPSTTVLLVLCYFLGSQYFFLLLVIYLEEQYPAWHKKIL